MKINQHFAYPPNKDVTFFSAFGDQMYRKLYLTLQMRNKEVLQIQLWSIYPLRINTADVVQSTTDINYTLYICDGSSLCSVTFNSV